MPERTELDSSFLYKRLCNIVKEQLALVAVLLGSFRISGPFSLSLCILQKQNNQSSCPAVTFPGCF